jgi:hypothetical protein
MTRSDLIQRLRTSDSLVGHRTRENQLGGLALKLVGQNTQEAVGSMAAACRHVGGSPA